MIPMSDRGEDACDDNAYAHSAGWCGEPVGPLRCDQILDCARSCNDDTSCTRDCLEQGTEDARRAHSALYDCLADFPDLRSCVSEP